ncbi:MAG: class A beta-lactamase-related serine hydrolase [Proteobacteria bacterium]|nr:class A beta-lactamase-related serine hydrolase [Pseudomonadota bacterium]MBU1708751.1 class A beta-lactamase-related serine hydrolase [Pseudomonadota bacterium]
MLKFRQLAEHKAGLLLYTILILLAGTGIGFWLRDFMESIPEAPQDHFEIRASGYNYINPLLDCELTQGSNENKELEPFEKGVEKIIENRLASGLITNTSVYFRDLNNGPWFSIRPTENFSPASLLKVPLMMGILKKAESTPELLSKTLWFAGGTDYNTLQEIYPENSLRPGTAYTIEALLNNMIVYSDNNAAALLEDFFSAEVMGDVYKVAGLKAPSGRNDSQISVEAYSRFFRILFNASYLNKTMSEKALGYIARVELHDGLLSSIPGNITVAHKFGEEVHDQGIKQLHECGIVYYPGHPYLLCVMTEGKNFVEMDDTVLQVSQFVYSAVNQQLK